MEAAHQEEEAELHQQLFKERQSQMDELNKTIEEEKTHKLTEITEQFETDQTASSEREPELAKV